MNEPTSTTVAQIVLDNPPSARVFERHRIDYCCAGNETLEAACAERGLNLDAVRAELNEAKRDRPGAPHDDPRSMSTRALLARIVGKHHGYLRRTLPMIRSLAAKVARVHGDRAPDLTDLAAAVEDLADLLAFHVDHEEQSLFPALANGQNSTVDLYQMLEEHRLVAGLLDRIFEASDGFRVPSWGCTSYRALTSELKVLDADVRQHIHLENHVLIPRFIRRASV
jgi:regulator of cell morphogenesis and NO signaling